jgi:Fe-S-cluster-containing dehydrogenase component
MAEHCTDSAVETEEEQALGAALLGRRDFLTALGVTAAGFLTGCSEESREAFFAKRFLELSPQELEQRMKRLRESASVKYGKSVDIAATPAQPGVVFGYALDLARCVGCRRCVYACVKENNQSRDPQIQWIRVLEMEKEKGIDFEHANAYYDPPTVPDPEHFYLPVSCQQCRTPQCTQVCPVGATWQEPDGIVVIDYDWCIGCRCCMSACPYGARHFNWSDPTIAADEVNPNQHMLGNRIRPRGVVEKCTFCIHRVRQGLYPACVEICPVGARKFGNLLDPDGEVSRVLRDKRVFVLKGELKTDPKFFYFYGV